MLCNEQITCAGTSKEQSMFKWLRQTCAFPSAVTPQNITATLTAVGQSLSSPSGPYVQHCMCVQALHIGLHKGPLKHNFELPTGTDKRKVAPKPWDSTTEVEKVPGGATGVHTPLCFMYISKGQKPSNYLLDK
jgi:hypothetical protein